MKLREKLENLVGLRPSGFKASRKCASYTSLVDNGLESVSNEYTENPCALSSPKLATKSCELIEKNSREKEIFVCSDFISPAKNNRDLAHKTQCCFSAKERFSCHCYHSKSVSSSKWFS